MGCQEEDGTTSEDFLANELLLCLVAGVLEWYLVPPPYTTSIDECPLTTPSARFQAEHKIAVFNIRGEHVELDAFLCRLLQLLDGTRNQSQLTETLLKYVQEGGHELRRDDNTPITDAKEMRTRLASAVELGLQNLANHAFLCRQG